MGYAKSSYKPTSQDKSQRAQVPVSFWNRRQQGTRFNDDAVLELRVGHERGAEHWAAVLVVLEAGLTRFIEQCLGDHARGALQGAPV